MAETDGDGARVLVASHSHPAVLNGGSEVASHALFQQLRARGWEARYLGCARGTLFGRAGSAITQPFGETEHLYTVGEFEGFRFANRDTAFPRDFRALLRDFSPHIVHLHHYVNFGAEILFHVRDALPDARLVLTLHEFLAICHQQGQMVKRHTNALCSRADPVSCSRCFPEAQPAEFFLRRLFIDRFFACVDRFVAPSRFLARRYVEWGIPADRIGVIENVPGVGAAPSPAPGAVRPGRLRVGFFGQISELKGMEVLLDAAGLLRQEGRVDISFAVHGDHSSQPAAFREAFAERTEALRGTVAFHGAYPNDRVGALMRRVDLVVVPSIWWENSPVVIQEAFRNGRAVLCSDIGGMAEKVTPGETGAHFPVGDARGLADALIELAADPALVARLGETAAARWDPVAPLEAHLALYRGLLDVDGAAPPRTATATARAEVAPPLPPDPVVAQPPPPAAAPAAATPERTGANEAVADPPPARGSLFSRALPRFGGR